MEALRLREPTPVQVGDGGTKRWNTLHLRIPRGGAWKSVGGTLESTEYDVLRLDDSKSH